MMLDLPALLAPKIKVMGFTGIFWASAKALKLPRWSEVIIRVFLCCQRLSLEFHFLQEVLHVRLTPGGSEVTGESTVENRVEKLANYFFALHPVTL